VKGEPLLAGELFKAVDREGCNWQIGTSFQYLCDTIACIEILAIAQCVDCHTTIVHDTAYCMLYAQESARCILCWCLAHSVTASRVLFLQQ
jgi:hypothetical protein